MYTVTVHPEPGDEYGIRLCTSADTNWENVPEGVRAEIEAAERS